MLIWHLQTCTARIVFSAHAQGLVRMFYQNMPDEMERERLLPTSYDSVIVAWTSLSCLPYNSVLLSFKKFVIVQSYIALTHFSLMQHQ